MNLRVAAHSTGPKTVCDRAIQSSGPFDLAAAMQPKNRIRLKRRDAENAELRGEEEVGEPQSVRADLLTKLCASPRSQRLCVKSRPTATAWTRLGSFTRVQRGMIPLILLAGIAICMGNVSAAIPPAEKLLPTDTFFVVTIPDCANMRGLFTNSAPIRFWNDAAMKPFREKFQVKWDEEFLVPLARDLGVKFDDYSALLQGQLTLAVTPNGWTGQAQDPAQPGLLFLLDAKDKSDQLKTNLTELRKKWTDAGKAIKNEKVREVEFSIVPFSSNDVPKTLKGFFPQKQEVQELGKEPEKKTAEPGGFVVGQFESLLIVGDSIKTVEGVVAHLTGGNAPTLADNPAFEQDRLARFRDAPLFGWFNAKGLFDILLKIPPDKPNPLAPNPLPLPGIGQIITGLGLAGLKTVALTFRDAGEGAAVEIYLAAPEASRTGLLQVFAPAAKDAGPPPFVPADVVKFQRWRLDGPKTVATLEKMLREVSPQFSDSWNFLVKNGEEAMKQSNPSYDLRKNIFGNLGDDFILYSKAPRGTSLAELESPPSLLAIASPNAEQLVRAVPGLLVIRSGDALAPKIREFLGRRIYSIRLPAATEPGGPVAAPATLSYATSGGYVGFSTDAATLEEFLRSSESPGRSLRETAGLADAAQCVGGQATGMFNYENQNEAMRLMFEQWKKSAAGPKRPPSSNLLVNSVPFAGPEKSVREWMDFASLPEFPKVAKYFHFSVWAGSANADGVTYKFFWPTLPALK